MFQSALWSLVSLLYAPTRLSMFPVTYTASGLTLASVSEHVTLTPSKRNRWEYGGFAPIIREMLCKFWVLTSTG
jgi:hypothetical protein